MKLLVLTLLAVSFLGCSQQYREADLGKSDEEIAQAISELYNTSAASSVQDLADNGDLVVLYYAEDGALGPSHSIAALSDFTFMGLDSSLIDIDFDGAQVLFVDGLLDGVPTAGLVVSMLPKDAQSMTTESFITEDIVYSEGSYVATFSTGNGLSLQIRTYDVIKGEEDFKPVIQFKVYYVDSEGGSEYIGKFPVLVGFDAL